MNIPTHQKYGWLVFLVSFFVDLTVILIIHHLSDDSKVEGVTLTTFLELFLILLLLALFVAFFIEILATLFGKNKIVNYDAIDQKIISDKLETAQKKLDSLDKDDKEGRKNVEEEIQELRTHVR